MVFKILFYQKFSFLVLLFAAILRHHGFDEMVLLQRADVSAKEQHHIITMSYADGIVQPNVNQCLESNKGLFWTFDHAKLLW